MFKIFKTLILIIWLIDIFDISFVINGIEVAALLDETIPMNFWGWFLFWLLSPTTHTIVETKEL